MDSTSLIVIFLMFTAVTLVFNTLLIWFAYKGFANLTMKITDTAREFETSGATRRWLDSLQAASEQAVTATELTKQKIAEFDPAFADLHARYGFLLAQIDTKMERLTIGVSENATRVRDAVVNPAEKFAMAAYGVQNVLGFISPANGEDAQE